MSNIVPMYYIVTWGQLPTNGYLHYVLLDIIPCHLINPNTEEYIPQNLGIWGVMAAKDTSRKWLPRKEFEALYGEVKYP